MFLGTWLPTVGSLTRILEGLAFKLVLGFLGLLAIWLLAAYLLVPEWWKFHWSGHPVVTNGPRFTRTGSGNPGDPLNLAFIGSETDLVGALLAAGWSPADPITLRSSLRIAESTIFHRPYEDAPVSNLFLFNRRKDLAFERPVGNDARQRHHVRFWQVATPSASGKPYWLGAITFDRSVGFSHTTGRITHHIAPDIDAERDGLIVDLQRVNRISGIDWQDGFQDPPEGRNGDGDPWKTDGRLPVITLTGAQQTPAATSPTP
jgi:hypothetical protein